jgi:hypothetical protein
MHAERDDNGAGERRHVDHDVGLEAPRVVERVAEDQRPSASVLRISTVRPARW